MPRNETMETLTKWSLITADCTNCPWMKYAIAEVGVKEVPGDSDNPRVVEYLKTVGFSKDSTEWCSAFVNWCMKCAGAERTLAETKRKGVSAAGAKSWMAWGLPIASPRFGTITVLNRPPDPASGHVAFYIGEYSDQLLLLGGNQKEEVRVLSNEKKRLLGYRWSGKTFGGEIWV
jgi:uncharacterized protein (TIGR02594 family)